MKSLGGCFESICAAGNLRVAMKRAARGKMDRAAVTRFLANADTELEVLEHDLRGGTYEPAGYDQFRIMDPKPRRISCAPFRDRVVHHAVCGVIGPVIERRFVADSFACRKGRGTHRAVLRAQQFARRFRYFCKLDVARFFDSVDHEVLLGLLVRLFREQKLLVLLERIVRHPFPGQEVGKGLPIGNLTSQWFANLYLDGTDHFVKDERGVAGFIRYMDDMLLFAEAKAVLWEHCDALTEWLAEKRLLSIKERALILAPCSEGIPFLGVRVFPGMLRFQHARYQRMVRHVGRREKEFEAGAINEEAKVARVRAACADALFLGIRPAINT